MRRFLAALLIAAVCLPTAAQADVYDSILILVNKQNALPQDYEPGDLSYPDVAYAPCVAESRKQMRAVAARALGCSRAHLSYVLHGKRKPSERLARALKRMGVEVEG